MTRIIGLSGSLRTRSLNAALLRVAFDASGSLTDEDSRKRAQGYVAGFAEFVSATKRRR